MRIRRAQPEDSAAIARLHRSTIRTINSRDYPPKDIAVWSGRATAARVRSSHEIAIRYVAVENEKIIGFCDISKEEPDKLWGLYIHKNWLGKGVGGELLDKITEVAKKQGAKKFTAISTITARPFYESKGFHLVRKTKHAIEDRKLPVFIMEKRL